MKISLCLHNHQPVGNFEHVMESAFRECYMPLLEVLERHGGIRLAMHHSGCLLDWLEARHPEYVELLGGLCGRGRMELLSGGFYEPVVPVWRRADIRSQLTAMNDRLEKISGVRPTGVWLTERVWEPSIPTYLAGTGITWAVVDDLHLRLAGLEGREIGLPALTEDSGHPLHLLGSSRLLRYAVPFHEVDDVMELLEQMEAEGRLNAFYGDDGEKFGVWPGTRSRCFDDGWLDEFLSALEEAPWLEVVLPGDSVRSLPSTGPVYVPDCSYPEMGEWALPAERQAVLPDLRRALEGASHHDHELLLRTGFWRNFLSKYPEANEMHKRVLHAEKAVRASGSEEALHHLWRSQCNCAYWHGVFGGLYLPHLREAVRIELHEAERAAHPPRGGPPSVHRSDIDFDGCDEILAITGSMSVMVREGDGLAVSELAFLPAGRAAVPLGHVLTRRLEPYHEMVSDDVVDDGPLGTIHGDMHSTEEGLASSLSIDSYRRLSFRDIVLPGEGSEDIWRGCRAGTCAGCGRDSHAELAVAETEARVRMGFGLAHGVHVNKEICISLDSPRIDCWSEFTGAGSLRCGCEICLNLLTGSEPDRTVRIGEGPAVMTGVPGSGRASLVRVDDGWRKVSVAIRTSGDVDVWHMPLDSVNRSEKGYERVHQGLAILLSTPVKGTGELEIVLELSEIR